MTLFIPPRFDNRRPARCGERFGCWSSLGRCRRRPVFETGTVTRSRTALPGSTPSRLTLPLAVSIVWLCASGRTCRRALVPSWTVTKRDDDMAQLTAVLEHIVEGTFGIRLAPDEITARYGDAPPEPLHRLRLAAALAGVADRLMFDVVEETSEAGFSSAGVLESAERQAEAGFDPRGHFRSRLHPLLFRLFRMQRAFSVDPTKTPDAEITIDSPVSTSNAVMFAAGLAMVVGSNLLRFGLACARDDEMEEAQEAATTLTAVSELSRVVGGVVAPREIRWTGGPSAGAPDAR